MTPGQSITIHQEKYNGYDNQEILSHRTAGGIPDVRISTGSKRRSGNV